MIRCGPAWMPLDLKLLEVQGYRPGRGRDCRLRRVQLLQIRLFRSRLRRGRLLRGRLRRGLKGLKRHRARGRGWRGRCGWCRG